MIKSEGHDTFNREKKKETPQIVCGAKRNSSWRRGMGRRKWRETEEREEDAWSRQQWRGSTLTRLRTMAEREVLSKWCQLSTEDRSEGWQSVETRRARYKRRDAPRDARRGAWTRGNRSTVLRAIIAGEVEPLKLEYVECNGMERFACDEISAYMGGLVKMDGTTVLKNEYCNFVCWIRGERKKLNIDRSLCEVA